MRVLARFLQLRQNLQFHEFFPYILMTPFRKFQRFNHNRVMVRTDSLKDRFTLIYHRNVWGSKESASGSGSTMQMTESIRNSLPVLIKQFEIRSVFDAPYGDFNWMKMLDFQNLTYIGGDIVDEMIFDLQRNFENKSISFITFDITKTPFPKSDLVLNRDCLFHLSYQDILATFHNFLVSKSSYFLSTSHDNAGIFQNSNIHSGDFLLIDLFAIPFNFPKETHFEIPEPGEGSLPARKLYLWDREQVQVAHSNLERFLSGL